MGLYGIINVGKRGTFVVCRPMATDWRTNEQAGGHGWESLRGMAFALSERCGHRVLLCLFAAALTLAALTPTALSSPPSFEGASSVITWPIVFTQIPVQPLRAGGTSPTSAKPTGGSPVSYGLDLAFGPSGRVMLLSPNGKTRLLTAGFESASDPSVSFDGKRILFAGRRGESEPWNIYEIELDGNHLRQITRNAGNCRCPSYQSMLYTIDSPDPWYQITFVSDLAGTMTEDGRRVARHLYSCKLDGSDVQRITYNLSDDGDPFLMGDGRILYASWQRGLLSHGPEGRVSIFGINIDGTDYALFAEPSLTRNRRMPCVTSRGVVLFIEAHRFAWDGSGHVGSVSFRRPLKTYRRITKPSDGLFYGPSPWPDGRALISRRSLGKRANDRVTHGICLLDPRSGSVQPVYDDPGYHEIQAKAVRSLHRPDGRSSIVNRQDPNGKFYCMDVFLSDLGGQTQLGQSEIRRLRVLEGIAAGDSDSDVYLPPPGPRDPWFAGASRNGLPPIVQRRILGELDVMEDGSFQIEVPANTSIQLQTLDKNGMALRSCGWIWARNRERRGCIGCHEDGELAPENVFVKALQRPAVQLTLPANRRRTVDFRRDVMPIIDKKCVGCHDADGAAPRLDGGLAAVPFASGSGKKVDFNRAYLGLLEPPAGAPQRPKPNQYGALFGRYVDPGQARTSRLIWHLFDRNTSRPWDTTTVGDRFKKIPKGNATPLTESEKRTFVEWIDMGALWDGIPGPDAFSGHSTAATSN